MSTRVQLACAWCGPVFLVGYVLTMGLLAGYIPPTDPSAPAAEIAAFYEANRIGIRAGQVGGIVFSALLIPFFTVISLQIARIEGRMPALAVIQLSGAVLLVVLFQVCGMLWVAASFRAELDAGTVRLLHDLSWLIFVMVFPAYTLQMICQALAGFVDHSPRPTWPRWMAYFNLWVGFSGAGGALAVFFKQGPFAYNGLVGFWIPASVFAAWVCLTTWLMVRAVKRQDAEADVSAAEPASQPALVG